jgi:hypothetical protein
MTVSEVCASGFDASRACLCRVRRSGLLSARSGACPAHMCSGLPCKSFNMKSLDECLGSGDSEAKATVHSWLSGWSDSKFVERHTSLVAPTAAI